MNIKQTLFILFFVVAFTACKKEYSYEKGPSSPEVITVGSVDLRGRLATAAYWVDSNFFYVEPTANTSTLASAVEKWNGSLVILGSYMENNIWKPCYWMNNKRYLISLPAQLDDCYVNDARIFKNELYVLIYDIATPSTLIYKINTINGSMQAVQLPLPNNANTIRGLWLANMVVINNTLNIFGNYTNNVNGSEEPCIWKIDINSNITFTTLNINDNCSLNYGDASTTANYITGYDIGSGSVYIYNEKGMRIVLRNLIYTNNRGFLFKVNNQNNLYLTYSILNNSNIQPMLCIIDEQQKKEKLTIPIPLNHNGDPSCIDVQNNEYAIGVNHFDRLTRRYYGFIQRNNTNIPLHIPNHNLGIELSSIKIFDK